MRKPDELGLPTGRWVLDPSARVMRYQSDKLEQQRRAADRLTTLIDEIEGDPQHQRSRYKPKRCVSCPRYIHRQATRCIDCHKARRAALATGPKVPCRGYLDPIVDHAKVARVIDGERIWCNRAERFEVITRWPDTGQSWKELDRITGWKSDRHRKQMAQIDERKAA